MNHSLDTCEIDGVPDIYDVVGIGFGPANIALAVAAREEAPDLNCKFLEARSSVQWQPGMMMRGVDIQNHPVRDLATLRNPRSRFTFLNYLHMEGRLLTFLNLPAHFPLRKDYERYIRWVADNLADVVDYDRTVVDVRAASDPEPYYCVVTSSGHIYRGRSLVVATGRSPHLPPEFRGALGPTVFHSNDYQWRLAARRAAGPVSRIAVVGASQSAAEIALDLHSNAPDCEILSIMRSFGYRLKDTSPYSEEAFLPAFTDYYFNASVRGKADLDTQLRATNYSSVDRDIIESLYVRCYEDDLDGRRRVLLYRNSEITEMRTIGDQVVLSLRECHTDEMNTETVDLVVLATGFDDLGTSERGELHPPVLASVAVDLASDKSGTLLVERDYFVPPADSAASIAPLFLNGLCESSHGLGDAGSFSLLSLRAGELLAGITKRLAATAMTAGTSGSSCRAAAVDEMGSCL